jgi:hypothetical protein
LFAGFAFAADFFGATLLTFPFEDALACAGFLPFTSFLFLSVLPQTSPPSMLFFWHG